MNIRNIRAKLVALTVVDEEGNRYSLMRMSDQLGKKSPLIWTGSSEVAQRLSGLKDEDVEELQQKTQTTASA